MVPKHFSFYNLMLIFLLFVPDSVHGRIYMKYGHIYPHSLGVPPGSTAQFTCHSIVQPVWTRQGNALNSRSTVVNNSLIIKQVKTTDEGKYRCVGIDSTKSLFIRSSQLYVGVTSKQRIKPKFKEVNIGDEVKFTCYSRHKDVHWMFNNGPINKYAKVISFNTLLILKAVTKHTGLYSCRGWKRKLGFHTQFIATAELRVFDNSRISDHHIDASIGDSIKIACYSSDQVNWDFKYENNVKISRNMLKIFNVTRSNYGRYVCRGTKDTINRWTGKKGIFHAYFTLKVHGKVLPSRLRTKSNDFISKWRKFEEECIHSPTDTFKSSSMSASKDISSVPSSIHSSSLSEFTIDSAHSNESMTASENTDYFTAASGGSPSHSSISSTYALCRATSRYLPDDSN